MAQNRNTDFVGVSLTPLARDALRRLAHAMTTHMGRPVPMSEAVIYAEQLLTIKDAIARLEAMPTRRATGENK